jgi:LuxR family maltose regulon positive regulatory protein
MDAAGGAAAPRPLIVVPDLVPSGVGVEVRRERLLRRLRSLPVDVQLVAFVAPRGYGKTTTARQWTDTTQDAVHWLSATPAHGDPARLTDDLARIGQAPEPGIAGGRLGVVADRPDESITSQVLAAIRRVGRPVMVVLDDLHQVRSGAARELVVGLAEQLPRGSRMVALTDERPRWRVSSLIAQGRYRELGVDDLAFDRDEADALARQIGLRLPTEAVDELVERTEGWPLGLQLAMRMAESSDDPLGALRGLSGDTQVFAEYFRHEVLWDLPSTMVRFLMQTAVLETVSGPLCDAVLATTGLAARLELAADHGLYLRIDGRHRGWYRYHRLFAEMLRAELRRSEPAAGRRILRRASQWYQDQGRPTEAIELALAAGDSATAARLIVVNTQYFNSRGQLSLVRGWLEQLDEGILAGYPPLAPMAAWIWALMGDAPRARRALRIAEAGSFDGPLPDGSVSIESAVLRARAALAPDGVDRMLLDAGRAVTLEPPGSYWHTQAALMLGAAHLANGTEQEATRWFEHAAQFSADHQRPGASTALGELALLAADRGDWPMARTYHRESANHIAAGQLQNHMPTLLCYLAGARLALHGRDVDRTRAEMQAAVALYHTPSSAAFPWLTVQAAVLLGRLYLELGDPTAAAHMLADARRHVVTLPDAGVMPVWIEQLAGAVEDASARSKTKEASTLTAAELGVLRLLPTHLSLAQIADQHVVSRNTVKTQVASIYRKLGVNDRTDAVDRARAQGLLDTPPAAHDRPPYLG